MASRFGEEGASGDAKLGKRRREPNQNVRKERRVALATRNANQKQMRVLCMKKRSDAPWRPSTSDSSNLIRWLAVVDTD